MFQTASGSRHPFMSALAGEGMHVWSEVGLALTKEWFFVSYAVPIPHGQVFNAAFLSTVSQVIELLGKNGSQIEVRQLMIVSPGYLNRTEGWQMEALKEILEIRGKDDQRKVDLMKELSSDLGIFNMFHIKLFTQELIKKRKNRFQRNSIDTALKIISPAVVIGCMALIFNRKYA